jgi:DNA-binding transcriptional MerR regulator
MKVGELARATGLTVRTLHHYDAIGLLTPSGRTSGGHRRYDESDVARLYRICLLRRLGVPLEQIGRTLEDPAWSFAAAVRRHAAQLEQRAAVEQRLRQRLTDLTTRADDGSAPVDPGRILEVMEGMIMLESTVQRRISILVYEDIEAAHEHLVRVFGLGAGPLERDGTGQVVHGEVVAGDGVIWLHRVSPEFGLASPRTLGASTGMTAVMVEDADAHHAAALAAGAEIEYAPVDQPYGMREYGARGPERELWAFMTPLD